MSKSVVLLCHAVSAGDGVHMEPTSPRYLKSYDIEAHNGRGAVELTADINEALQFASVREALQAWNTQSRTTPLRDDGRPNKPLTALTVELLPYESPKE